MDEQNPYDPPRVPKTQPPRRRLSWQRQSLIFVMLLLMLPTSLMAGGAIGWIAFGLSKFLANEQISNILSAAIAVVAVVWVLFSFLSSIDRLQRNEFTEEDAAGDAESPGSDGYFSDSERPHHG